MDGPDHGTLLFNPDGTFTYTAEATYSGTDSFTYRAADGEFQSNLATATINVLPRNLPPVSGRTPTRWMRMGRSRSRALACSATTPTRRG